MDKTTQNLYDAVDKYIKSRGGHLVYIGGVQIMDDPRGLKYNWTLGIKCTGRRPEYAKDKDLEGE